MTLSMVPVPLRLSDRSETSSMDEDLCASDGRAVVLVGGALLSIREDTGLLGPISTGDNGRVLVLSV